MGGAHAASTSQNAVYDGTWTGATSGTPSSNQNNTFTATLGHQALLIIGGVAAYLDHSTNNIFGSMTVAGDGTGNATADLSDSSNTVTGDLTVNDGTVANLSRSNNNIAGTLTTYGGAYFNNYGSANATNTIANVSVLDGGSANFSNAGSGTTTNTMTSLSVTASSGLADLSNSGSGSVSNTIDTLSLSQGTSYLGGDEDTTSISTLNWSGGELDIVYANGGFGSTAIQNLNLTGPVTLNLYDSGAGGSLSAPPGGGPFTLFSVNTFTGDPTNILLLNTAPFVQVYSPSASSPFGIILNSDGSVHINLIPLPTTECRNPITGNCTISVANTGFNVNNSAIITVNGADIGELGGRSLSFGAPDIELTLRFESSQVVTGEINWGVQASTSTNIIVPSNVTATFNANVNLQATDSLSFALEGKIPDFPLFNVTNGHSLTLASGSTLSVDNPPLVTQTITLASAGTVIDQGAIYTPITISGLNGTWILSNNTIALQLLYPKDIQANATWSNTQGIGQAMSEMDLNNLSGELKAIVSFITAESDDPLAMNNALAETAPLVDGSALDIWKQQIQLSQLLLNSPASQGEEGYNAGDFDQAGHRIWITGTGTHYNQQSRQQISGYRGNSAGVAFGAELVLDDSHLGLAVDVSELRLTADGASAITHIDHAALDLYGRYQKNKVFVDGIVAGGHNHYDTTRNITYGTVSLSPHAQYHGWQADVLARLGIEYNLQKTRLTPYLLAQYDYLRQSAYTETNAGTANQMVAESDFDQFLAGGGIKLAQTWNREKVKFCPTLYANILYALKNTTMQTSSQFASSGPSFVTRGATPARTQYLVGMDMTIASLGQWDAILGYNANIQEDFLAQTGFLRFRYLL